MCRVELPDYRVRLERVATVDIEAFDWNCPQHVMPRHTVAEAAEKMEPLRTASRCAPLTLL
jgi:hypothetical protein